MSADFHANPTDISWQKVVFLVIQNYVLLLLSWTTFSCEKVYVRACNIYVDILFYL